MEDKIEEFFRDATADDVARVMHGQTVEARFRDNDREDWREGEFLGGFHRGNCEEFEWKDRDGVPWQQCQVYDPPEWYINKPEPGEGYRLLEKFPPEDLQKGDEAFDNNRDGRWGESDYAEAGRKRQCQTLWYRRRIETNSPAILDSSRSRNTIPRGWRLLGKDEERLASDAYWSQSCKEWIVIGDDRMTYANDKTCKWHAIRQVEHQVDHALVIGFVYHLPDGSTIRITAKGFEVL